VKVFETHGTGPNTLVKKGRSNRNGTWRVVQRPHQYGHFYAKAVRQKKRTPGTTFVCRADHSKVVTFIH
jgi:hypothetical protein